MLTPWGCPAADWSSNDPFGTAIDAAQEAAAERIRIDRLAMVRASLRRHAFVVGSMEADAKLDSVGVVFIVPKP